MGDGPWVLGIGSKINPTHPQGSTLAIVGWHLGLRIRGWRLGTGDWRDGLESGIGWLGIWSFGVGDKTDPAHTQGSTLAIMDWWVCICDWRLGWDWGLVIADQGLGNREMGSGLRDWVRGRGTGVWGLGGEDWV